MRIAVLTHAEAADSAVFANLARHLLAEAAPTFISNADRPDVGVDVPLALSALPVAAWPADGALGWPDTAPGPGLRQ